MIKRQRHYLSVLGVIAVVALATSLVACEPYKAFKQNEQTIQNNQDQIQTDQEKGYPKPPAVKTEKEAYVDTTPIPISHTPMWMQQTVSMRGTKLPFSFYVGQMIGNADVVVQYDSSVDKNRAVSFDFSGSVKDGLGALTGASGYAYTYSAKTNVLTWSAYETKVFDISFMPGDSQYQVGESAGSLTLSGGNGSSSGSGGSSGSSGSGSSGSSNTGYDFSQDTQYSKLTGTVSVWTDMAKTMKDLLSKDGTATVSQSTTTVTVRDHPSNVQAIAAYLGSMNHELSRQVRIHVQLLEVRLKAQYNYGIDWNVVRRVGKSQLSLLGNGATNADNVGTFSPIAFAWQGNSGLWSGTNSVIQALEQQGNVSLITQPTVTTLNNQVATIAIQQLKNYINSTSSTLSGGGSNFAQGAVNTGTITTGISLYLLPKIQKNQVFLQISSILSDLTGLSTINTTTGQPVTSTSDTADTQDTNASSSGSSSSSTTDTNSATPQVVQLPEVALRSFNQRSVIPNGATLILAGFIQNGTETDQSKVLDLAALGGQGSTKGTTELVMLITPVILSDNENDLATGGYQDATPGGAG